MRKRIVCDAVPFCFGPISKLISIAEHLANTDTELILLCSGTSRELGEKSGLFTLIDCNTEQVSELQKHRELIESADVFVNVMNPVSAKYVLSLGVPVVCIDSLFWMWDKAPEYMSEVDKYFVQAFHTAAHRASEHPRSESLRVVGPIIDTSLPCADEKEDYVVVSFGGMESALIQIGVNSNYPFIIGDIVARVLKKYGVKAYFCGNDAIVRRAVAAGDGMIVGGKSHKEFLEVMRKAKLLITTPGLTTAFEACHYGVPVAFLPPENYSQSLNQGILTSNGVGVGAFHWSDLYSDATATEREPEEEGVAKVLSFIKRFENDSTAQGVFATYIESMLSLPQKNCVERQRSYLTSLGPPSSETIAKEIVSVQKKVFA